MQDLNTINKLNAEAIARDIPAQQRNGHHVVAEFNGLTFVGYSLHSSEREANSKACELGNQLGTRTKVYYPTTESVA